MKAYRQGDVLIINVENMPFEAQVVTPGPRGYILAEGEATGHAHTIEAIPEVEVRSLEDALFIYVGKPVKVRHEEHAPILLPEGMYKAVRQVEFTPGELRRVLD